MNTRIRYEKTDNAEEMVSVRTFTIDGTDYRVYLNVVRMTYQVVSLANSQVVSDGAATSLATLKAKAKKALGTLGYSFAAESRNHAAANACSITTM